MFKNLLNIVPLDIVVMIKALFLSTCVNCHISHGAYFSSQQLKVEHLQIDISQLYHITQSHLSYFMAE